MDGKNIKIVIKSKKRSTQGNVKGTINKLENQVEIKNNCLKYFYGCWIKCINKQNGIYSSGGFLTRIQGNSVYLRNIQNSNSDPLELFIDSNIFYVKKYGEQYIAMQQIELEKEKTGVLLGNLKNKLKSVIERENVFEDRLLHFENEKLKFEIIKNKFFKLFQKGKIKILC